MTDGGSLAIDAGQSGIKVRHADAAGASEWSGPGIRTDLPLLPQLARVIEDAVEAGRAFDVVGLGVSGLTSEESDAGYLLAAAVQHGVRAVHLAHDSITAYLGALGDDRGVVVASGTGVVTLAVGRTEVARVDGWGYLIGDAGSGYWLGRAALDAVMRAHDGRGEPTVLTEVALAEFPDLERAYIDLQSDPARVGRIAAYARHVAEAAAAGDTVALGIVDGGGARARGIRARGPSTRRRGGCRGAARARRRRRVRGHGARSRVHGRRARAAARRGPQDRRGAPARRRGRACRRGAHQRARGAHRVGGGDGFVRLLTAAPPTTILRRVGGPSLVGLHGERRPSVPHGAPVETTRSSSPLC